MMEKNGKIYVAGHRRMVGSAIVRALEKNVCPKAKNGVLTPIIYIFYSKNSCKTAI